VSGEKFDEWVEQYRPIENTKGDSGFCFDGRYMMFESYGSDLAHVLRVTKESPEKVWTIIEGDDGEMYLTNGYHIVNRFGHFITEVEHDGTELCIPVD